MIRGFACVISALLLAPVPTASAQAAARYRLDKITDGVYLAVPGVPGPDAANIPVLVSDRDVILVGTHLFPADAQALVQQVKTLTDKPVRYIVNTHYHAVPTAAGAAFPAGIDVIGHELARKTLLTDGAGNPRPAGSTVAPPTVGMTTRLALYRGER